MENGLSRQWALPIRIILGLAFMVHGAPKLFDAAVHHQFQGMLGQLGVPAPALMSWVVGIVEFFGGACLVLGLFTWVASGLLIFDMVGAMVLVHLPQGFDAVHVKGMSDSGPIFGMPGYEVNLVYIAGLLALFVGGPGPISIDARARRGESPLSAPWVRRRAHA
jgi:putative oxidoreductase